MEMINRLETQHLILRKATGDDLNDIWKNVWSDPSIAENMLWKVTEDESEARKRLERTIEYQKDNYAYFICLKETGEVIGFAGVRQETVPGISERTFSESGICIATRWQNRGYGRETVEALKKLVFDDLEGDGFLYSCFSDNERSRRLAESCGFVFLSKAVIHRDWDDSDHETDWFMTTRQLYYQERD